MKRQIVYIGNGTKNGIYQYQFEKGTLTKKQATNDIERCTYLANSSSYLYGVREIQDKRNKNNGYVVAYKKDKGKLIQIDEKISLGQGPCHISVNEKEKKILISNYIDGTFVIFQINQDGTIGKEIYSNCENKEISHVHCAEMLLDNQYLLVVDLGADCVIAYEINKNEVKEVSKINFKKNTQPRHIAINKNMIYVITESTCMLYTLKFESKKLNILDAISLLPPKVKGKEDFTGCAIKISKDFRHIYVTIRGDNSISVYKVKKEKLTYLQNISCEGNLPRDLEIDKSGKYVLVANQESNEVSIFKRNTLTGKLTYREKEKVESPTCIIIE